MFLVKGLVIGLIKGVKGLIIGLVHTGRQVDYDRAALMRVVGGRGG